MLFDSNGRSLPSAALPVVDRFDGYSPDAARADALATNGATPANVRAGIEAMGSMIDGARLDSFINELTGLGDPNVDRQLGGYAGGPKFNLVRLCSAECEARYRGSDIGRNAIDKFPDEMTRRGWDINIQPTKEEQGDALDPDAKLDTCYADPRRAAAGWRMVARSGRLDSAGSKRAESYARRWDAIGAGVQPEAAPPPPPGALPEVDNTGTEVTEATDRVTTRLGLRRSVNIALKWERAFGGAVVFIGVDDGGEPLWKPLDLNKVRKITHLTPLRGGFDGPVVMYRPYRFAISEKYGQPELFQVRNFSVPIVPTPYPGEVLPADAYQFPASPTGPTLFGVHESRFLIFDGKPATVEAQQENRGWGDSVFTRAGAALAQFESMWQAVGSLVQTASIDVQAIPGFIAALAENSSEARGKFVRYAQIQSLIMGVARTKYIDKEETYDRKAVSFGSLPELLGSSADRLAAAFDMPVSVLFGNLKGGLGAKEDPSIQSFYDRVSGKQETDIRPQLDYFYRVLFRSKTGPTKGVEPERWAISFPPLRQLAELEQADLRSKTSAADVAEIAAQIVSPEEVTATRYGGAEYNAGPIVLDMEARKQRVLTPPQPTAPPTATPPDDAPPTAPPPDRGEPTGGTTPQTPPITPMATDPITGDPTATTVGSGATRKDDRVWNEAEHHRAEHGHFGSGNAEHEAEHEAEHVEAPNTKWVKAATPTPTPQRQATHKETGAPLERDGKPIMTGAPPGSQLEPHVLARLVEYGARLPPAHITDVHVVEHLNDPRRANVGMVAKWNTVSKTGKVISVPSVSKAHIAAAEIAKFSRTESQRPAMAALQRDLEARAGTSPAHAAAAIIADTGLRRGGDDNEPGHYGALTMEARHVTFSGDKAHIEYVGKGGTINRATIDSPALVHALKEATAGKSPTDPVWGKGVNEKTVQATLLPGQMIKDLRTIAGTNIAERELSTITPKITGNAKADAREIGAIIKAVSIATSQVLNNKPAQALKSYIAPQVLYAWADKHGVPRELIER